MRTVSTTGWKSLPSSVCNSIQFTHQGFLCIAKFFVKYVIAWTANLKFAKKSLQQILNVVKFSLKFLFFSEFAAPQIRSSTNNFAHFASNSGNLDYGLLTPTSFQEVQCWKSSAWELANYRTIDVSSFQREQRLKSITMYWEQGWPFVCYFHQKRN